VEWFIFTFQAEGEGGGKGKRKELSKLTRPGGRLPEGGEERGEEEKEKLNSVSSFRRGEKGKKGKVVIITFSIGWAEIPRLGKEEEKKG